MSKLGSASLCMGVFGFLSVGLCRPAWSADLDLYGVGHLSFDDMDTGVSSSTYVHSNSSRLGIKGDQDLNDFLSVYVQYESGVDLTAHGTGDGNGGAESAGQIFTRARDSFLGLKSSYGSIQFGRVGGLNQWLYDYNLFADQVGDLGNAFGGDGAPGRLDDSVMYISPSVSGFRFALTYVPDEGAHNQHDFVAKADYGMGGLKVGAAYAKFGSGSVGLPSLEMYAATVSYTVDLFNVGGAYQHEMNVNGISAADRDQATFGATVQLGANLTVKAQYAWSGEVSGAPNSTTRQLAAGLDYNLASSTAIYFAYARTSNSVFTAFSPFDYGHGDQGVPPILDGKTAVGYTIGLVYKFEVSILKPFSKA
jgi:predicted porin